MLRSPYYGKKALLFGVPRTDCRFSEVEAFDRVGAEGIWSRWLNVSNWPKKLTRDRYVGENTSAPYAVRVLDSKKSEIS